MKSEKGFTLLELLVVIAIVGIMAATAVPLYRTYQQRAYGSEASLMVKRLLDAQIIYFLDKNTFFPNLGETVIIGHYDSPNSPDITRTKEALNIEIPVRHFLTFTINHILLDDGSKGCLVTVSSVDNRFPLFKGGYSTINGLVNEEGKIEIEIS